MKTLVASILIATSFAATASAQDIGQGIVPDSARQSVRTIITSAVRNFLNFRRNTPLSDTQRQQIAAVLEIHRPEIHSMITRARDARRAYAAVVKAQGPDAFPTKQAAQKLGDVARDRALLIAKVAVQVRPLLTAEQQKAIESAREEIEGLVDQSLALASN